MSSMLRIYLPLFVQIFSNTFITRQYLAKSKYSMFIPCLLGHFFRFIFTSFFTKTNINCKKLKLKMFILAIIYELQSIFLTISTRNLSPIVVLICAQIKIPMTCILSIVYLKQRFTKLQYFGLLVIFSTMFFTNKSKGTSENKIIYILLQLGANAFSSIGNIYFNKTIAKSIPDFISYVHSYSQMAFYIACVTTAVEIVAMKRNIDNHVTSPLFYLVTINFMTFICVFTYFSIKINPQKRFLVMTLFMSITSLVYQYKENVKVMFLSLWFWDWSDISKQKIEIDMYEIFGLLCTLVGIFIYEHKNVKRLFNGSTKGA